MISKLAILLADDDTDDCIFFEAALAELKFPTFFTAVHDGEQLMQLLMQETVPLPNVLFLDLNMPRKNGFECLIEIKQNPKLKNLLVIVYSTSFEQEVVNRLFDNGAQYFIRKPSEFSQFKKIIQQTLSRITNESISPATRDSFVLTVQSSVNSEEKAKKLSH